MTVRARCASNSQSRSSQRDEFRWDSQQGGATDTIDATPQVNRARNFPKGPTPLLNVLRHSATAGLLVLMTMTGRAQGTEPASGLPAQQAAKPVTAPKRPATAPAKPAAAPTNSAATSVRHTPPSSPGAPAPIPINRTVIVLDPAHGGVDSGSQISDKTVEKNVTLALAFRLRSLLTARGFSVVMTRDADAPAVPNAAGSAMTLDDRAGIANHAHAAACLVLHATPSGTGVHLYRSELEASEGQPFVVPWLTAQAAWIPQSRLLEKQMTAAFSRSGLALVASNASVRPIDSLTCPGAGGGACALGRRCRQHQRHRLSAAGSADDCRGAAGLAERSPAAGTALRASERNRSDRRRRATLRGHSHDPTPSTHRVLVPGRMHYWYGRAAGRGAPARADSGLRRSPTTIRRRSTRRPRWPRP